jgi:hypothetical protein
MRVISGLLVIGLALAALQLAAKAVAVIITVLLLVSFISQPRETFGCLFTLLCFGLIGQYPVPGFLILGGLVLLGVWSQRGSNT